MARSSAPAKAAAWRDRLTRFDASELKTAELPGGVRLEASGGDLQSLRGIVSVACPARVLQLERSGKPMIGVAMHFLFRNDTIRL